MKAWQIKSYGSTGVFQLNDIPDPQPKAGWVLIDIKAFGINRSELYTRQGHSGDAVTLPRVLGIECVGLVADGGGTDLKPGQKVAAAMGNMGRLFDGGYAEKTLIPRSNVYPVDTSLDWATFGALPETYLTAWGVLKEAIDLPPGGSLLVRGGTSSVGLACTSIAKEMGCTVLATTRKEDKVPILKKAGVDHVLMDSGKVESQVKAIFPKGVNGVVELVGKQNTIMDCLQCTAPKGTVGLVGFLGDSWEYQFFPWMPSTVKLTIYSSETLHTDYATPVLQTIAGRVAQGIYRPNIHQVFSFEELPQAHEMMEQNRAAGKLVVRV
ncbi:MAG: zinc-binding dehydrogenase [Lewinellaceae bacterium]|nr:zinc-binding dehydrogenase [Phaeodactylibacter sp.]MCB9041766.1 zinc-binding dehydrogenase [Lewinellaceae bacterium]